MLTRIPAGGRRDEKTESPKVSYTRRYSLKSYAMQLIRHLHLVGLAFAFVSCSQRGFNPKTEEQKLLRRDAEWADLAAAGKDVDKVVSYWTDDAVLIFPGQPIIEGKAAIRAHVASCFSNPVFKIHWKSSKVTGLCHLGSDVVGNTARPDKGYQGEYRELRLTRGISSAARQPSRCLRCPPPCAFPIALAL